MNHETCDFIKRNGYIVCSRIGSGGYSSCYTVISEKYKQKFVCKIVSVVGNNGEARKKSFYSELDILTRVIHRNIIHIFQTFANETHVFLILEFCQNGDFANLIHNTGPITDKYLLLQYVSDILDALTYLQQNSISHGDIKPSNIFIDKYGRPQIADFGLASTTYENELSSDYRGSLVFISPEILLKKPYDPMKSDVWSFGVTLFYMATGKYPFKCSRHIDLKDAIKNGIINIPSCINDTIKTLITKSLVLDPNKRASFSALKEIVDDEIKSSEAFGSKLPLIRKAVSNGIISHKNLRKSFRTPPVMKFNRKKASQSEVLKVKL